MVILFVYVLEVLTPVPWNRKGSVYSQTRPPAETWEHGSLQNQWGDDPVLPEWEGVVTHQRFQIGTPCPSPGRSSELPDPGLRPTACSAGSCLRPRPTASPGEAHMGSTDLCPEESTEWGAFVLRGKGFSHLVVMHYFTWLLEMAKFFSGHNTQGDSWSYHPAKFSMSAGQVGPPGTVQGSNGPVTEGGRGPHAPFPPSVSGR